MKLSVLIPVYNERAVVERSLAQVVNAPLPEQMERELIVVDDRSTDGTWDILTRWPNPRPPSGSSATRSTRERAPP